MKVQYPRLQIRIYTIDGSTRTFVHNEPDLVDRTLMELHPALIFNQDRHTIVEEDVEIALISPLITRIDLMTERLSVWDFPFVLGALMEVTEAEFTEGLQSLGGEQTGVPSETPVFLDVEMVSGERLFLWMRVVAGLSAARLGKVYSLLKERRLIFGLRTGGVGVLNLSNLVRFSVFPKPLEEIAADSADDDDNRQRQPAKHRTRHGIENRKPLSIESSHDNRVGFGLHRQRQTESADSHGNEHL